MQQDINLKDYQEPARTSLQRSAPTPVEKDSTPVSRTGVPQLQENAPPLGHSFEPSDLKQSHLKYFKWPEVMRISLGPKMAGND
jgi:hypothetical protein